MSIKKCNVRYWNYGGLWKRFRCVEYSIVAAGALNALGIPARTVGLRTKYVETELWSAGHVVAEAYLKDLGKGL